MKRELVIPDLLAAMTADALFAGKPQVAAAPPPAMKRGALFDLGRWFKRAPGLSAAVKPRPPRLTLDDDWVGGWYARTRLLQATTLANAGKTATSTDAPGRDKVTAKIITQVRDLS